MRTSRAEPGCLEYTLSADPTDPRRVMLFERWARQEDLDNHLAAASAPRVARHRHRTQGGLDLRIRGHRGAAVGKVIIVARTPNRCA
jgi:antibiotic biosynthesis monooxygenase